MLESGTKNRIRLTIHGTPVPQRITRTRQGGVIRTERVRIWMENVAWQARQQYNGQPLTGDLSISVTIYTPRKHGDWDNLIKPIMDALQGIVYLNDKQIVEMHVALVRGAELELTVLEITQSGG